MVAPKRCRRERAPGRKRCAKFELEVFQAASCDVSGHHIRRQLTWIVKSPIGPVAFPPPRGTSPAESTATDRCPRQRPCAGGTCSRRQPKSYASRPSCSSGRSGWHGLLAGRIWLRSPAGLGIEPIWSRSRLITACLHWGRRRKVAARVKHIFPGLEADAGAEHTLSPSPYRRRRRR